MLSQILYLWAHVVAGAILTSIVLCEKPLTKQNDQNNSDKIFLHNWNVTNVNHANVDVNKHKDYVNDSDARKVFSVVVNVVMEDCDSNNVLPDLKVSMINWLNKNNLNVTQDVEFMENNGCEGQTSMEITKIMKSLSLQNQEAVLLTGHMNSKNGGIPHCGILSALSAAWSVPALSWNCPGLTIDNRTPLIPSLEETLSVVRALTKLLKWKTIHIVTTDDSWWPVFASKLQNKLENAKITIGMDKDIEDVSNNVIIICAPFRTRSGQNLLKSINNIELTQTTILAIDVSSTIPYLPTEINLINSVNNSSNSSLAPPVSSSSTIEPGNSNISDVFYEQLNVEHNMFELDTNLSVSTKDNLLILSVKDVNSRNLTHRNELFEYILSVIDLYTSEQQSKHFEYVVLDWREDLSPAAKWWPILNVEIEDISNVEYNHSKQQIAIDLDSNVVVITKMEPYFSQWEIQQKSIKYDFDCEFCFRSGLTRSVWHGLLAALIAVVVSAVIAVIALAIRNYLLKRRLSRGPNRIVLTASDFVFPQVADSRRVDEGIEAMLCCWLQQLQEFGGPEVGVGVGVSAAVDKPDLLKGSVGSLRAVGPPPSQRNTSGSGSLVRNNHVVDLRARYNGDLVQMKQMPTGTSSELKAKAMDFIKMAHGLRHENINPLIGWLPDPSRSSLIFEFCTRGSLQDVLVKDEIPLDWTFRLSLMTDLVRGMRYLHSSPVRAHGGLTSRNCVIDARWALKLTDYGLPTFYEHQGITPPTKTARELLWTAPELLRVICGNKEVPRNTKGMKTYVTQPSDVYSFGIIMQEVVLRGDPYCMLSLTPEEIIEKVKRPPPLIRPSVSKGAAPPEAINIMRQCWAELPEMRPDSNAVHDLFKKLNLGRKGNIVDSMFQLLEKYSNNLETLVRNRTEELELERRKTEQLLFRMLPITVAERLKIGVTVDPEEFSDVTIYFSDIVGFTSMAAHCSPVQVVDFLNDLYTCFDATINAYNVYKVETIGDAYMVVGGLPTRTTDHAEQIATMALDLLHQSGMFKIRHLPGTPLQLRIGLHSGTVCAGVVGLTMPRYCLFGDTVNTASRMESTGAPWRIHLSQATHDRLQQVEGYILQPRGSTQVKGKGVMTTFWLLGKVGFDKVLPTPPPIGEAQGLAVRETILEVSDNTLPVHQVESVSDPGTPSKGIFDKPQSFMVDNGSLPAEQSADSKKSCLAPSKQDLYTNSTLFSTESETKLRSKLNDFNKIIETTPIGVSKSSSTDIHATFLPIPNIELSGVTSTDRARFQQPNKFSRKIELIEEHDLTMPYNHYKCLSPSEYNLGQASKPDKSRLLKRQFSLDRTDDSGSDGANNSSHSQKHQLHKQNSAGAANDLEKIEELPLRSPIIPKNAVSLSVDALAFR